MRFEYAVEPKAVVADWKTCLYLMEQFGFDRGRLLSLFPKAWFRMAYDASAHLKPIDRKRVEDILARSRTSKTIRSGRPFSAELDWLRNAVTQHAIDPFHAIIAQENPQSFPFVLRADEVDETHPLMISPRNWEVPRVGTALAGAMAPLLRTANTILFVDKYFKFDDSKCKETLHEALLLLSANGQTHLRCEIHIADHPYGKPMNLIEPNIGRWLRGVIPDEMSIVLYYWKEKVGGADFHARYLLTDRGGMNIDAGFSAEGSHQTVQVTILESDLWKAKLSALDRTSTVYELAGPILQVSHDGKVQQI